MVLLVKMVIALTTINSCKKLLESYLNNFRVHKCSNVGFVIIGDKKTPDVLYEEAKSVRDEGFLCEYWDVKKQIELLSTFPSLAKNIPYNSDNRRNIGYLRAAELGAEIIVSIDDDNFVGKDDFFGCHNIVGAVASFPSPSNPNLWFNPCFLLDTVPHQLYMRGFPVSKRLDENYSFKKKETGFVALNMGLWLEDPDVDAWTNLMYSKKKVLSFMGPHVMLQKGENSPINSQNTAIHKSVLPCYYFVSFGRSSDIWQGYFTKKIIDQMDERVTIGLPLTIHFRNKHNLIEELGKEVIEMSLTERLVTWLNNIQLEGNSYAEYYGDLASKLSKNSDSFGNFKVKKFIQNLSKKMLTWLDACDRVM